PLSLPPPATNNVLGPPPITAPRSRPLTRLTPFGRKASPARIPADLPAPTASPIPSSSATVSPSLAATGGVSYLDSLGLRLGEAVNKALILPAATHPTGGAAAGITKVAANAAAVGGGAKVGAYPGSGVSEGPDAVLKGKRPLPVGRGRALGALITSELHQASNVLQDSFLHRAILRLLQRPLTVLTTNLTQQVTQLLLAPEFSPSVPVVLNATQVHALAYAHFASELLETFDTLGLGRISTRGGQSSNDGLKPLKDGLENVVSKVVGPFVSAIKTEVSAVIAELEKEPPQVSATATAMPLCSADQRFDRTLARVAPLLARVTFAGEASQSTHVQSMLATFEIGVVWGSLVALSNRPLPRCASAEELTTPPREPSPDLALRRTMSEGRLRTQPSDSSLSTSSSDESAKTDYAGQEKRQQLPSYITPPDTPQIAPVGGKEKPSPKAKEIQPTKSSLSLSAAVNGLAHWTSSSPITSPANSQASSPRQITPPSTKKLSIVKLPSLKPLSSARAPSPPMVKVAAPTPSSPLRPQLPGAAGLDPFAAVYRPFVLALHALARDAKSVQLSVKRLVLPVEGGLARDAVDEALKELAGFVAFADYLAAPDTGSSVLLLGTSKDGVDLEKLMKKTRQAPMLLVLPVLLRVALLSAKFDPPNNTASTTPAPKVPDTVSAWIGLPEDEYRRSCLGGFGKADECAAIVGKAVLKNKRMGVLSWMKEWLERSVREEEEDSSSDEEDEEGVRIHA
ncbi:hypothetical protein M407DRAFT_241076, partial [Tulasnella calospora MUT 4182]